jgi:hypothetical protein
VRQLPIERDDGVHQPGGVIAFRAIGEELDRPEPGDGAEGQLQHARPVDADQWRIGLQPAFQLPNAGFAIANVTGQPPGAPKTQPVLMAVQLPDHFVIAARGIEVGHVCPERARRPAAADRIELPVDAPGFAEAERRVAEEVVLTANDAVGVPLRVARAAGERGLHAR